MFSKVRAVLDDGFIVGLVFALFLAGKIVPYLVVVGVVPILLFWNKSDYAKSRSAILRFALPAAGYFALCLLLLVFYPGLEPGEKPPRNPDLELYIVAVAMLAIGFLRGQQIKNLYVRFQAIAPWSLAAAFAVLSGYMFLGIRDDCRVRAEAAWPFIPAIIFTTLTFLLLLGWEGLSRRARFLRLALLSLSVVVVLGYTGSRGVAVAQFGVFAAFILLRLSRKFRAALPTAIELLASAAIGALLCLPVQSATGCNNFGRLPTVFDIFRSAYAIDTEASANDAKPGMVVQAGANEGAGVALRAEAERNAAQGAGDPSVTLRLDMWAASVEAIWKAPFFGHGALSLRPIIQDRFGFEHNHNQYLSWLVTGGIVFLCVGLLFLFTPYLVSYGLPPANRAVLTLSVTGLWGIAMVFDSFLSLDFYLHYFSLLLGFLFALTSDMVRAKRPQNECT
jgi:hypothetical protein